MPIGWQLPYWFLQAFGPLGLAVWPQLLLRFQYYGLWCISDKAYVYIYGHKLTLLLPLHNDINPMSKLFNPIKLGQLTLDNRIMVSPMCQYSAQEGNATAWHYAHLGGLALSGAGLLCLEATAVTPKGRITPSCLGLWNDANEDALAGVLAMIRAVSPIKVAIQLAHAGRKASSAEPWLGGQLLDTSNRGWVTKAPSELAHKDNERPPHAMDDTDLQDIKKAFVASAQRAVRLGVDAIELHSAHGYLLHQFLSPIANQREDRYGGSLENRMRYPLEVFQAIRAIVPSHIPIGIRISASDWVSEEASWDIEQSKVFARAVAQAGAAWIDVSSAGVSPKQQIDLKPGYQVPFAEAIKNTVDIPVIAVGLITEAEQAEAIIAQGQADMVALARALLYDPRWPWHAAAKLGAKVYGSPQYWRSVPTGTNRIFGDTTFGQR